MLWLSNFPRWTGINTKAIAISYPSELHNEELNKVSLRLPLGQSNCMCVDALRKGETGRRHTTQTFPLYIYLTALFLGFPWACCPMEAGAHTNAPRGSFTISNGNKDS